MSKRIDSIAINLLDRVACMGDKVKFALSKNLALVLGKIRALNSSDAMHALKMLSKFPNKGLKEFAFYFIFFAIFRKDMYKDWKWSLPGLYDDLAPEQFDERIFITMLDEMIKIEDKEVRFAFAAQFEKIFEESIMRKDKDKYSIALSYLTALTNVYDEAIYNNLIYDLVSRWINKKTNFDELYSLLLKCLRNEKNFYEANISHLRQGGGWRFCDNEDLLQKIFDEGGEEKFLECFSIISSFPKEVGIFIDQPSIDLLNIIPKENENAKKIVKNLFDRNHSQYFDLHQEWFGTG
ncbi:hypothetical protein KKB18_10045 [bacterium]|nr:hypothetical protein [bacterium]